MTYNITDLDPSTDYKLTVTAHTSAGEGKGVSVIGKTELFTGNTKKDKWIEAYKKKLSKK